MRISARRAETIRRLPLERVIAQLAEAGADALGRRPAPDSEEVLTTRQAAKRLKLSQPAVRRLCARGAFAEAYKTSGHTGDWRIPLESLRAHQDGAPQPAREEEEDLRFLGTLVDALDVVLHPDEDLFSSLWVKAFHPTKSPLSPAERGLVGWLLLEVTRQGVELVVPPDAWRPKRHVRLLCREPASTLCGVSCRSWDRVYGTLVDAVPAADSELCKRCLRSCRDPAARLELTINHVRRVHERAFADVCKPGDRYPKARRSGLRAGG